MCERGFGRLVFTSSTAGEKAERSGSAYTTSKHGYRARTRGRPGRWTIRSHIQRSAAWLGANGDGRALGEDGGRRRGISVEQVWSERAAIYRRIECWSRERSRR